MMISKKKIVAFVIIALILSILSTLSIPVLAETTTGVIYVHTEPSYVKIYVDGEYSGETDAWGDKNVQGIPAGTYTLKLSKSNYKDWSKTITVEAGKETEVYAYLEEGSGSVSTRDETISPSTKSQFGTIVLNTEPSYVKIYVDGEYSGETDAWGDKNVQGIPAGTYTLKLSKSNYKDWSKTITVEAGKETEVYAYLEEGSGSVSTRDETISPSTKSQFGTIVLNTEPSYVKIYVDGEYSGETDAWGDKNVQGIPAGTYTLKLSKSNYKDWSKTITVEAVKEVEVYAYLEPISTATPAPTPTPAPPEPTPTPVTPTPKVTPILTSMPTSTPPIIIATPASGTPAPTPIFTPTPTPTPPPVFTPTQTPSPTSIPSPSLLPLIPQKYIYILFIVLLLILLPSIVFYVRRSRKSSSEQKEKEEKIFSLISESITIKRAIYDPCKRDFIEGRLPRMKEWINRYDPGAYWFAMSIQSNTDKAIEEWGVDLETSSALKVEEARVEGIEYKIELRETYPEPYKNVYAIGVPKEYGIVIPKGGAQRVYFKLRAEKPKTTYEISGVFKSAITGDVPIRPKEFKYLCDAGVSPEAVKTELKKTFSEKDAARLALSFKTIQELDRMCDREAKTDEYMDKLLVLKNYTEGFSDKFSTHVNEFSRFMKEEQLGYLDDKYKGKVKRFCTNLVDVWISEFLKW